MILILTFETERERDTFEYIYERYKGLMLYKAREILKDTMLAEDAVSEAFLRIYKNIHRIGDPDSRQTAAFVMVIVKNVSLTLLKKKSNLIADWYEETDSFDMEASVISADGAQRIYGMLDACSEQERSVFLLKYAYGMSHKEIGGALGMSENNVTVRLHRTRKKLASMLKEGGYANEFV